MLDTRRFGGTSAATSYDLWTLLFLRCRHPRWLTPENHRRSHNLRKRTEESRLCPVARSAEAACEERFDGRLAAFLKEARAGTAEKRLANARLAGWVPGIAVAVPSEPRRTGLVENVDRTIEKTRVFSCDTGAAGDCIVGIDFADHEDFLAVLHLVPNRLQNFAEHRRVRILPMHQLAQVAQADVAMAQLCLGEDTQAVQASVDVALEGEIHFVDAKALSRCAERCLGTVGRTA